MSFYNGVVKVSSKLVGLFNSGMVCGYQGYITEKPLFRSLSFSG